MNVYICIHLYKPHVDKEIKCFHYPRKKQLILKSFLEQGRYVSKLDHSLQLCCMADVGHNVQFLLLFLNFFFSLIMIKHICAHMRVGMRKRAEHFLQRLVMPWSFPFSRPSGNWAPAHMPSMLHADWGRDLNHGYYVGSGFSWTVHHRCTTELPDNVAFWRAHRSEVTE